MSAPVGALAGALVGMFVAKKVGYHHTLIIVSFATVGTILGATVASSIKK